MKYQEWCAGVPSEIRDDPLWRMEVYRLALFATEIGWEDVTKLGADHRTCSLADQLYRALGSISANIAEGYSRGTGRGRAHFYEYALGSARESRDWFYKAHHILAEPVIAHRLRLLTQIIRLLLVIVPHERGRAIKEDKPLYDPTPELDPSF